MEHSPTVHDNVLTDPASPIRVTDLTMATPLQKDILRVLSYFDIFQHPLTAEEIYAFLPSNSTSPETVTTTCLHSPLHKFIFHQEGYYSLTADIDNLIHLRREKEALASDYFLTAKKISNVIRHVPFVRGIFISGELSKGVASKSSDIDFFLITAKNRLWICRSFFPLFKRLLPPRLKHLLCFNTFIAEHQLTFEEQNIYTAIELATLKPISGGHLFPMLLEQNKWITNFLPNFIPDTTRSEQAVHPQTSTQHVLELFLSGSFFTSVDRWLLKLWKFMIAWKFSKFPQEQREKLFLCKEYVATGYSQDHSKRILEAYHRKLSAFQFPQ